MKNKKIYLWKIFPFCGMIKGGNLMEVIMFERLDAIEDRYEKINELMSDPDVVTDIKKVTELSKEQSGLEKIVVAYREYKDIVQNIADLKEMLKDDDNEIKEMAEMELEELEPRVPELEDALKILLIPKDPNDERNVIAEIRGAAGGDEANIFAGDLYRMYTKFADAKGWKIDLLEYEESSAGGVSQVIFMIKGDSVYSHLKYESGSHRVQRIPATESQGRIHTSTATVVIMPEAEEFDVEIHERDIRVDTFRSGGAGGQSVNTTDSAVRVTHVPTGTVVTCQDGKSQHENKESAMKVLRARIYEKLEQERAEKEGAERKAKIGTGDRSEKIRTYNYPQNRVTDHRIGFTLQQLDRVMEGKLDAVIEALITEEQKQKLKMED